MPKPNVRVELFFKTTQELRERVKFLASKGVTSFNLVNKSNQDTIQQWTNIIREEIPDSSICAHYSLKYNKSRKKDGAFLQFNDFVKEMNTDIGKDRNEILLITGSGAKGKVNSLTALQKLPLETIEVTGTETGSLPHTFDLAAAYNPFFPSEDDLSEEKDRLLKKLETNKVNKVYLQFGTDLDRLRKSLDWLTQACPQMAGKKFAICGSIFLPTKKLIAQQKFRPWNGVFLSEKFLESEAGARKIVLQMMRLYEDYGCEILIEAPGVRNENDMKIVDKLLKDRDTRLIVDEGSNKSLEESDPVCTKRRKTEKQSLSTLLSNEELNKPAILLFGSHDVRLHDNEALQLASFHKSVIPTFIWCKEDQEKWGVKGAAEVVLKDALRNLDSKLQKHGLKLICRSTKNYQKEIETICLETGSAVVYWNREHTPESHSREIRCKEALKSIGVKVVESQSSLLYDPTLLSLSTGFHGGHWGTLMPFLKGCKKQFGEPKRPITRDETYALVDKMNGPKCWPDAVAVDDLNLAIITGKNKWDAPILKRFPMSEDDAVSNLNNFFHYGFHRYESERSRADIEWSTSKLSAHLRVGTISPNEFYFKIEGSDLAPQDRKTISRRLFWRDLAYYQLSTFPDMRDRSIRTHYEETNWVTGDEEKRRFDAWKKGETGYPLVDAGMRELYATGWMTQSVRMVVASFLTEYLRVNWVKGCEWFHYTLVDADSAINAMMWQNAGRSGIDQWNFIMSPVAASQDGNGSYTKKWVPELSKLSKPLLHKPWEAPKEVLGESGIILGETYPHRVVTDLQAERQKSVDSVLKMRQHNQKFNDSRGYDLVTLPDGKETVVFTKKEYRIDRSGNLIKISSQGKEKGRSNQKSGHKGRNNRKQKR